MTYRCNLTRKSWAIFGGVMGGVTLLITVIVAGVLVANKNNRTLDTGGDDDDNENGFLHSTHSSRSSALYDSSEMYCFGERKNSKAKSNEDESWPFRGPIVGECDGKFSIDTFDDEQALNAATPMQQQAGGQIIGNHNFTTRSPFFVLPTEKEIAQKGHYSGLRPIHYNLSINVLNEQQFDGRVDILFRVCERSDRIILDVDLDALQLAADEITLRQFCADESQIRRPIDLCVTRIVKLRKRQALIVQLNTFMEPKERYVLSIGAFRGTPLTRPNDPSLQKYQGSVGLRLADKDGTAWALTTIFQMRYARTVFPCFDHPIMKARFTIGVERPIGTLSASNTALDHTKPVAGQEDQRERDQYRLTPPLPPYVITFSVMQGYLRFTSDDKKNETTIELYYPDVGQKRNVGSESDPTYAWIVGETRQIMKRIEEATDFEYGQQKLGFINVNPAPFWGIENYGLVTLESGFSRYPDIERGHTILVHEIVHQWLGDVVTISLWDEICLQEGLTAYFEWKLSEQLPAVQTTLQLQARRARAENMRKDEINGQPLIRPYNKTDDIAEVCFGKPPLIFHMIAEAYGSTVWELFLTKLLADHSYGNANFETWISTIASVTKAKETGEFLRQWFTEPGHPILYVSIDKQDSKRIQISQGLVLNGEISSNPKQARHVPLKILTQTRLGDAIFVNSLEHVAHVQDPASWVLVDPDSVTFTRKVYTVSNYRSVLDCLPPPDAADAQLPPQCAGATRERVHEAFDDFCFALFKNSFPWGPDKQNFDLQSWTGLFDRLHNATTMARGQRWLQVDRACECCFRTKEELEKEAAMSAWHPLACKRMWNEMCRNLNIMQMTGKNYTAPDKEKATEQQRRNL